MRYLPEFRRLLQTPNLLESDHERCPDGSHWDPQEQKCVDTKESLHKQPHGTILTFQRGSAFAGKRVYAMKTHQGWHEIQPNDSYDKISVHKNVGKLDPDEMIPHAKKGTLGMHTPGVSEGERIRHPAHLDALPDGTTIHHPAYKKLDDSSRQYTKKEGAWVSDIDGHKIHRSYDFNAMMDVHPGLHVKKLGKNDE